MCCFHKVQPLSILTYEIIFLMFFKILFSNFSWTNAVVIIAIVGNFNHRTNRCDVITWETQEIRTFNGT